MRPSAAVRSIANRTLAGRPLSQRCPIGIHALMMPTRRFSRSMSASWQFRELEVPATSSHPISQKLPAPMTGFEVQPSQTGADSKGPALHSRRSWGRSASRHQRSASRLRLEPPSGNCWHASAGALALGQPCDRWRHRAPCSDRGSPMIMANPWAGRHDRRTPATPSRPDVTKRLQQQHQACGLPSQGQQWRCLDCCTQPSVRVVLGFAANAVSTSSIGLTKAFSAGSLRGLSFGVQSTVIFAERITSVQRVRSASVKRLKAGASR